ncbi:hypothetical protein MSG28_006669 [Choristoneura fumiferana]|uniref:Uncharacterized protein n=1 Tax=Choristoneura fumiferana TaxID=7141 RepID=A0ACC0JKQ3_CHOFU|nr:hypothetical protein MSG28_006669 [Choristoneura fumiferana]
MVPRSNTTSFGQKAAAAPAMVLISSRAQHAHHKRAEVMRLQLEHPQPASESLASGRGIQVVSPSPDHSFHLDLEALSALLLREDLKDRAVVVVSVAGAFRKGQELPA